VTVQGEISGSATMNLLDERINPCRSIGQTRQTGIQEAVEDFATRTPHLGASQSLLRAEAVREQETSQTSPSSILPRSRTTPPLKSRANWQRASPRLSLTA
jgi:hypothetical protein